MCLKIFGFFLLFAGIVLIIYAALSTYQVFSKKASPINLFSFSGISMDPSQFIPQSSINPEISQLLKQSQGIQTSKKTEMIPADLINDPANIFAHLMLMGFLATIGFKLASLGTMLVRPIVVHLKAKETVVMPEDSVQ